MLGPSNNPLPARAQSSPAHGQPGEGGLRGALWTPKSQLYEFYQRFLGRPVFDTTLTSQPSEETHYVCCLTCPAVVADGGRSFPEQVFTGEGRNRRAAEHAAAYAALAFIESLGMFAVSRLKLPPAQPPPALVPPALVQAPVTPEEVRLLQQNLAALEKPAVAVAPLDACTPEAILLGAGSSSNLSGSASSAGGYQLGGIDMTPKPLPVEPPVSLAHLPRDVLEATLHKSVAEINSLRQKLAGERDLRYRAVALLSQGG